MNICITGTARSGTTAIYTLLQKVLIENYQQVKFYYEPFLWDKDTFNDIYEKVNSKFSFVDSISHEGIINHLYLPLFIDKPEFYSGNAFLTDIFRKEDDTVKLIKFIRVNGRIRLLAQTDPECRFIFIIRNPLDVVNSLNKKFSFFGGEFYRDDYPRFLDEIDEKFNFNIKQDDAPTYQEKLLLYWKYMNQYALQSIKEIGNETLLICQEQLERDPESVLERICSFLKIPYQENYLVYALERKSEVTREFFISKRELDTALPYLNEYLTMMKKYDFQHLVRTEDIIRKYSISAVDIIIPDANYGLNTLLIAKTVTKISTDISLLRKESAKLNNEILVLKQQISDLLSQQNKLSKSIAIVKAELNGIKTKRLYKLLKFYFGK